jgi:hypothetical protein
MLVFIVTAERASSLTSMDDRLGAPVAEGLKVNAGAFLTQIFLSTLPVDPDGSPQPTLPPVVSRIINPYIHRNSIALHISILKIMQHCPHPHSVITKNFN